MSGANKFVPLRRFIGIDMLCKFKNKLVESSSPMVMAIVNLTDDSFYAQSRHLDGLSKDDISIYAGADIIDLGACSTRPGSVPVSAQTEWERLEPALKIMQSEYPEMPLSVDTFRPELVGRLAGYGVDIINDVSGGSEQMYQAVAEADMTYVLTHNASYVSDEAVVDYFCRRADQVLRAGVKDLWIDPGFGFGKTVDENYRMLALLPWLKQMLGMPVLVGLSRKSMITVPLATVPQDALEGTVAANTIALMNGADILRVHDVLPARQLITVYSKFAEQNTPMSE